SGRMGFALAQAGVALGARVVLVAGPCALPTPEGVERVDVRSATDMHAAVLAALPGQDLFVSAAAVADYRPRERHASKLKKHEGERVLELVRNPDILADVAQRARRPYVVGFAAETGQLHENAREKLQRKRLDLIAANLVGAPGSGFDAEHN